MREYTTPLETALPATGNLAQDARDNAELEADRVVMRTRGANGWTDVTARQFHDEVRSTAKGLVAVGIEAGDRVALLARTRYEWTVLDYAIWYAGAVSVPIYETSSPEQVATILTDSTARALVVESAAHRNRLRDAVSDLHALEHVWSLDESALQTLGSRGTQIPDDDLDRRLSSVNDDAPATIIYTSGATGGPKGCVLTHANIHFEVTVALHALRELFDEDDSSTLLFLPLPHVFARVVQVGCVKARVCLGYSADAKGLAADLAEFRPTFILGVPRVFEMLFNTASQNARIEGRGTTFDKAADTAIAYSRALERGRPGPWLRARHALYERLVFRGIRETLGGACRYAVSGGAPFGERLSHFYRGAGLEVLEGYGLTETSGAVTVNRPGALRIGTVGQPLGGTAVRVGADGEILVRGGQVMSGYWQDAVGTAQVVTGDGWLRTGDLGEIDDEGFLRITGRQREMLVTAGGKNVAPAALEERIRAHPLVSQCLVIGDGRPFISALITLDREAVSQWAGARDKKLDLRQLVTDPELRQEVQTAVDRANEAVSQAESVRKFAILPRDWSEEGGELTPSLKLKRSVVARVHRATVEELYKG